MADAQAETGPLALRFGREERFRDLFQALREDSVTNSTYLVLMLLSTLLATLGLYQNSAAVVIGAMLIAPLMTPIISLSMGVLRQDMKMSRQSAVKIVLGVIIALLAAALLTLVFPHKPVTEEMMANANSHEANAKVRLINANARWKEEEEQYFIIPPILRPTVGIQNQGCYELRTPPCDLSCANKHAHYQLL